MPKLARRCFLALCLAPTVAAAADDYPKLRILPEIGIALHLRPGTVEAVRIEPDDGETWTAIVTLTPEAGADFAALTELNVGKFLTFYLDGEAVMRVRVTGPIQGGIFIVVGITEAQARRFAGLAAGP